MVEEYDLIISIAVCVFSFPNENVSWVSVTMDEPMFEYHFSEGLGEGLSDLTGINATFPHSVWIVDLKSFDIFHGDYPVCAIFCMVLRNINFQIVSE